MLKLTARYIIRFSLQTMNGITKGCLQYQSIGVKRKSFFSDKSVLISLLIFILNLLMLLKLST